MSRARSKTVDTAEVKKNGLPRRLNEKIALMKKKELAQSQAFEQAMQSIFEVKHLTTLIYRPAQLLNVDIVLNTWYKLQW